MPFFGQPLFRYTLSVLKAAGVDGIGINTHHLPKRMVQVAEAETKAMGLSLESQHEPVIQGTGGGIRGLSAFLRDDDFIVFNGDILFTLDLAPIVAAHRASKAAATLVLLPMPQNEKYAAVETDAHGRVWRIAGQGAAREHLSPWHFTGAHIMSPAVFDFMSPKGEEDINRSVYMRMIEKGLTVRGHVIQPAECYWSDMGTPQRYLATHHDALCGRVPMQSYGDVAPWQNKGDILIAAHPSVDISNARISGPAYVAENARLGKDVRLGSMVSIGRSAIVGDGACLNRVAVLDGAVVPPNVQWEDCILGPGLAPVKVEN
jgi:mannose-1-phosphate guanylyltransferase